MNIPLKKYITDFAEEVLHSYAILFFSNNALLGALLMVVTFFKPFAGLAGLIATIAAILVARFSGVSQSDKQKGLFTFNALMMGIGMGTFYNPGLAFWLLLFILVLLTVVFSGVLWNLLGRYGLPFLAIPFILCFWLAILVSREFEAIDLTSRNIYWINDLYTFGQEPLLRFVLFFENLNLHPLIIIFFKSLSSIFFQDNVLAGMLIFAGLVFHSRIASSLLIIGFAASVVFNNIVHAYEGGLNAYLMVANFLMISVAIGSFFVIPSIHSYIWAVVCVPVTFIICIGLSKVTALFQLPVYTLPFCFVTLVMVFFFSLRRPMGRVVLTPAQFYSPENNLYNFLNNRERRVYENYVQLQLPFLGQWIVSQGYDGDITHKGDWSKALDFVIVDSEMKTYTKFALKAENFYCYNKPVLAPAYGYVCEIIDHIEDNEIGKINQQQNWGNSIVIKHAEGLYTKMSHLKKNSFRVKAGDYVKPGDIIAACGNSGRSPEPHLHFQVQSTPYVGSKTIAYPFASYRISKPPGHELAVYKTPGETEQVSNVEVNENLARAFEFLPGFRMEVSAPGFETTTWEVFTDALNYNYLYCYQTKSMAYFGKQNSLFYFMSFHGDRNSQLYRFYLSAYKVCLTTDPGIVARDQFPLQLSNNNAGKWIQDVVAPFYIFRKLLFESESSRNAADVFSDVVTIQSRQTLQYFNSRFKKSDAVIEIEGGKIKAFTFTQDKMTIKAQCIYKG